MNGVLLIDKSKGWTSFDVVAKVRGMLKAELTRQQKAQKASGQPQQAVPKRPKVGHTGTLDPLATGLLVVLLGKYTKRAMELTKLGKTYEVTMKLGEVSTTGDEEGDKTAVSDKTPSNESVEEVLRNFQGTIEQVPPAYSAVKVDGQRAYKLARAGKEVKIEPRKVTIHNIELMSYKYPFVVFSADVSSGTYIRSLVEDIGKELSMGAYMADLRRTRVGGFSIDDSIDVGQLTPETLKNHLKQLV